MANGDINSSLLTDSKAGSNVAINKGLLPRDPDPLSLGPWLRPWLTCSEVG